MILTVYWCQFTVNLTIDGPSDSAVGVEGTLVLTCRASSSSVGYGPTYFLRNSVILNTTNIASKSTLYMGYETTTLNITNVDHEDGGMYGCIRNSGGSGGSAFVDVNITVREGEHFKTCLFNIWVCDV